MIMYNAGKHTCIECSSMLSVQVFDYSSSKLGLALCIPCQDDFKYRSKKATPHALELYIALKKRGVPAELEKWDGHKSIDIAITDAKVNIEVDGMQHNFSPEQAMADLKRTFFAFKRGYLTLRIPNSLVKFHLEHTADYITKFLLESKNQLELNR